MLYKELVSKSEKELQNMLSEERTRLHGLRQERSINQLKDVRAIREVRKTIAQLLTQLRALKA